MKEYVRTILDYPVKGIKFRDITTLLQDSGHFKRVIDEMTDPWKDKEIDAVLSIESRGFIMAGALARDKSDNSGTDKKPKTDIPDPSKPVQDS